jgi:hypothetical protein
MSTANGIKHFSDEGLDVVLRRHAQQLVDALGGSFTWVMGTDGDGYVVTLPDGRVIRLVVEEASVCLCCGALVATGEGQCHECQGGE